MEHTAGEFRRDRLERVEAAIRLEAPDRVPFVPLTGIFPATYAGLPTEEAFYDYDRWFDACRRTVVELEPDLYASPATGVYPGRALDLLACRQVRWPPHGVSSRSSIQFLDGERMVAGEYDAFLRDPTDFLLRSYLPRIFGALEPLSRLPALLPLGLLGYKTSVTSAVFAEPDVAAAFETLYRAGVEAKTYLDRLQAFHAGMEASGFAPLTGTSVYAPFDYLGDMLRGAKGVMLDLRRRPEKLLEAMDRIGPIVLEAAVRSAARSGCPRVFLPLHWGSDGFLSPRQFETFYWPGLKKILLGLIGEGLTPVPFFEGDYGSRLEFLADLPKGKILGYFDATDLFRAREVIGDTLCLAANLPISLLCTGTPGEVEAYTKRLIDGLGGSGGLVMAASTPLDHAKPELVRVWAECTKTYGVYR